jgi:hypothetical protein
VKKKAAGKKYTFSCYLGTPGKDTVEIQAD